MDDFRDKCQLSFLLVKIFMDIGGGKKSNYPEKGMELWKCKGNRDLETETHPRIQDSCATEDTAVKIR